MATTPDAITSASDPADVQVQPSALTYPDTPPTVPNNPVPVGDISGLVNAGNLNQAVQTQKDATQNAASRASQPLPETGYTGSHARLLGMISGLARGMGEFGRSLATKGQQGGINEEMQYQQNQAELKMQQNAAAEATKNAEVQQWLNIGQANEKLANSYMNLMSHPEEMQRKHVELEQAQQNLADTKTGSDAKAQELFDNRNFVPSGYTVDPSTGQVRRIGEGQTPSTATGSNTASTQPVPREGQYFLQQQSIFNAGVTEIKAANGGKTTPLVQAAQKIIDDKNSTLSQINGAVLGVKRQANLSADVVDKLKKSSESSGAQINAEREQLAQNTFNRTVSRNSAGQPTEDFATWQARSTKEAEVKAQQGDPTMLGAMAADGLITIPAIAISRQLDKKGFQQLLEGADAEAKRNGMPEIVVNGRPTGHYFNATAATQQYLYVSEFNNPNSKSQQSIGAGSTFLEHSSDLLDVNAKYRRTKIAVLNTPLNAIKKNFGSTTYSEYVAAITPVKTEYDNALKAGFAPSTEDQKTVDKLLDLDASPAQIEAAVKVMAHTILRRLDSTNEGYKTHTGVDYPNLLTPDAKVSTDKMGIDTSKYQTGGSFGGTKQVVNPGTQSAPTGSTQSAPTASTGPDPFAQFGGRKH
jgi:hypothetical protein